MGWAVGFHEGRWIGYGVPSKCEHPECDADIDRGLGYACGGGVLEDAPNCGLFFCSDHIVFVEGGELDGAEVCERCAKGKPPFDPKPDVVEWLEHQLTDESWRQWRDENPAQVEAARAAVRDGVRA